MNFDKYFIFGVATSSYQIEGAHNEGGRTPSIWDRFCDTEGKVLNNENGDIACDHYHKYKEDVSLLKDLGVDSYRFSIAWPRIFPENGKYNPEGMEFYKNILKELKEKGIKSCVTLYHWDLPVWVQEIGGWENRDNIKFFLEYVEKCFVELDSLVDSWITHNEPWCASILSNALGIHAPGKKNISSALKVAHHLLLSHGETVRLYHKLGFHKPIGISLNLYPVYPSSDTFWDKLASSNHDGTSNRWFLEPLFKGKYPEDIVNLYSSRCSDFEFIKEEDFAIISEKCDFLGINYYSRSLVEYNPLSISLSGEAYSNYPKTGMGWDVSPDEFVDLIQMIRDKYTNLPIYITENGSAWEDKLENGRVHDVDRKDYLIKHIKSIAQMNQKGLNVAGYYCWSFLDNFEWSHGYSQRFGIVYVDYDSLERIKKDSYFEYQKIIKRREI